MQYIITKESCGKFKRRNAPTLDLQIISILFTMLKLQVDLPNIPN
jgi:hypothetical protein